MAAIAEAQAAEDEAQRTQAIVDAKAKDEAKAKADAKAKDEAEAQAIIDEQTQAVLNEEAESVTSFAMTDNLKLLTASPHEFPDKNHHQSKSTASA
jgi:membrane protein involved in colicin uptake